MAETIQKYVSPENLTTFASKIKEEIGRQITDANALPFTTTTKGYEEERIPCDFATIKVADSSIFGENSIVKFPEVLTSDDTPFLARVTKVSENSISINAINNKVDWRYSVPTIPEGSIVELTDRRLAAEGLPGYGGDIQLKQVGEVCAGHGLCVDHYGYMQTLNGRGIQLEPLGNNEDYRNSLLLQENGGLRFGAERIELDDKFIGYDPIAYWPQLKYLAVDWTHAEEYTDSKIADLSSKALTTENFTEMSDDDITALCEEAFA